jgi:hypothetical protein
MALLDARIPISLVVTESDCPNTALLVEGEGQPACGAAVAYFQLAEPSHTIGCACCAPRSAVGQALATLFQARAKGDVPFFRRLEARLSTSDGFAALTEALTSDPVAASYFRLADAAQFSESRYLNEISCNSNSAGECGVADALGA